MIIIFEGPRGAGKTTLAKATVDAIIKRGKAARYVKFQRGDKPFSDMKHQIRDLLEHDWETTVIDRFHLTEFVMRMYDHKVLANQLYKDTQKIDDLLFKIPVIRTVIVTRDESLRLERIIRRNDGRSEEMPSSTSQFLWQSAVTGFCIDHTIINNTQSDFDHAVNYLAGLPFEQRRKNATR